MKKEVLIVTVLVMMLSLPAVVYAAAITNPGHGVEEIGSGSAPYALFRDWNVVELGYEDQYSGPSALKGNVFWLATPNAETIAAQNSSADWCAIQIHPSGIYMNCFNNASNMTLYNSYYWNGTNFTKNDTIKNGTNWIEKKIIMVNGAGGKETTSFQTPSNGDTVTINTYSTTGGTGSTTTASNGAGTNIGTTTVTTTKVEIQSSDTGDTTTVTADGGAGFSAENTNPGAVPIGGGLEGTPTGGFDAVNYDTSASSIINSQFVLFEDAANAGTATTTVSDPASPSTLIKEMLALNVLGTGPQLTITGTEPTTGTNIFVQTLTADAVGNGQSSISTTEIITGLGATNELTQSFDVAGNGNAAFTVQDATATTTARIELASIGGIGNGEVTITAPTMSETVSGGNFITYLGQLPLGAGDPAVDIAGSDLVHELSFLPGLPTCVQASQTYAPGVGVSITDIDVVTGVPCVVPSTATFAFYAILND